jgi:hypothetical protein
MRLTVPMDLQGLILCASHLKGLETRLLDVAEGMCRRTKKDVKWRSRQAWRSH